MDATLSVLENLLRDLGPKSLFGLGSLSWTMEAHHTAPKAKNQGLLLQRWITFTSTRTWSIMNRRLLLIWHAKRNTFDLDNFQIVDGCWRCWTMSLVVVSSRRSSSWFRIQMKFLYTGIGQIYRHTCESIWWWAKLSQIAATFGYTVGEWRRLTKLRGAATTWFGCHGDSVVWPLPLRLTLDTSMLTAQRWHDPCNNAQAGSFQ